MNDTTVKTIAAYIFIKVCGIFIFYQLVKMVFYIFKMETDYVIIFFTDRVFALF